MAICNSIALVVAVLACGAAVQATARAPTGSRAKPNIVYVMTDE